MGHKTLVKEQGEDKILTGVNLCVKLELVDE